MKKPVIVSAFLLEQYNMDEIGFNERHQVEDALAQDPTLAGALEDLKRADVDFQKRFPQEDFLAQVEAKLKIEKTSEPDSLFEEMLPNDSYSKPKRNFFRGFTSRKRHTLVRKLSFYAALLVMATALPFIVLMHSNASDMDRAKGDAVSGLSSQLSVYLKVEGEDSHINNVELYDGSTVRQGDIIQLVYQVSPNVSGDRHGVIFSIDGRSVVTLHYPYRIGQTTSLVANKSVPLHEAYKLDDAPYYEMFFFVVSDKPLETRAILYAAEELAKQIANNPKSAAQPARAVFEDYELITLTLWKE